LHKINNTVTKFKLIGTFVEYTSVYLKVIIISMSFSRPDEIWSRLASGGQSNFSIGHYELQRLSRSNWQT
jgi:hypothetical protein